MLHFLTKGNPSSALRSGYENKVTPISADIDPEFRGALKALIVEDLILLQSMHNFDGAPPDVGFGRDVCGGRRPTLAR